MVKERVIAAMSGGVDSAVAAGLLLENGYDVVGITMKMYTPSRPAHAKSCCGVDDFDDARRSAATLGIPHYVVDFEEVFRRNVIQRFIAAFRRFDGDAEVLLRLELPYHLPHQFRTQSKFAVIFRPLLR